MSEIPAEFLKYLLRGAQENRVSEPAAAHLDGPLSQMIRALWKRIIIQGEMNHASGAEMAKLLATTTGIQKKASAISAGKLTTKITPTPKTTAFTMQ
jgi:hypothetical protein